MRSTLWTGILLTLTALLASCGGGGGDGGSSPSTTSTAQSSSTRCDSTTLWAAHPATSGRSIPDIDGTGISVSWDNQNCTLRTVSSATLEVCLSHPRTSDLTWTISPPTSGTALTLSPRADWNSSGTACDSGRGKFQRIDLLPTVTSDVSTRGNWTLHVKDQQLGDTGTLIQWRILIVGNT